LFFLLSIFSFFYHTCAATQAQSSKGRRSKQRVARISSMLAAEGLPIKSDYERSESKDSMVHSDKPQCVAKHSKGGKASNT